MIRISLKLNLLKGYGLTGSSDIEITVDIIESITIKYLSYPLHKLHGATCE